MYYFLTPIFMRFRKAAMALKANASRKLLTTIIDFLCSSKLLGQAAIWCSVLPIQSLNLNIFPFNLIRICLKYMYFTHNSIRWCIHWVDDWNCLDFKSFYECDSIICLLFQKGIWGPPDFFSSFYRYDIDTKHMQKNENFMEGILRYVQFYIHFRWNLCFFSSNYSSFWAVQYKLRAKWPLCMFYSYQSFK